MAKPTKPTKPTESKAARATPAPAPTPAPANDTRPTTPPDELAPLFDAPDEGLALPLAAIDGGRIEVYRYAEQNGKLVPAYTLDLDPRGTLGHIVASRGGGKYLLRAKDPSGRVVAVRRLDVEGEPIDPAPAKNAARGSRVDAVQGGAGMRLAIAGLSPEQQQLWLLTQEMAEERRREAEERAQRDAERHSRELARLETQHKQTLELLVAAFGSSKRSPEEESQSLREIRALTRELREENTALREQVMKQQKSMMELNVDLNAKTGDGETSMRDIIVAALENADTLAAAMKQFGFVKRGVKKQLAAGAVEGANGG
jgi:hypothetical protein